MNEEDIKQELNEALDKGAGPKIARYALSVIGGAIPLGGGFISGAGNAWEENEQEKVNTLFNKWLELQQEEIKEIGQTIVEILIRLDPNDSRIVERIESKEYLSLLKKSFRDWSAAESEEKRILIRNLLTNAAASSLTNDDIIRLFIEWIGTYSEFHFKIVGLIYQNSGIDRKAMGTKLFESLPRDNSAEADLFKLAIHDLCTGHVIRQQRAVNYNGQFLKKPTKRSGGSSSIMKSPFDPHDPYELTELGQQFVHYAMNELTIKIEG